MIGLGPGRWHRPPQAPGSRAGLLKIPLLFAAHVPSATSRLHAYIAQGAGFHRRARQERRKSGQECLALSRGPVLLTRVQGKKGSLGLCGWQDLGVSRWHPTRTRSPPTASRNSPLQWTLGQPRPNGASLGERRGGKGRGGEGRGHDSWVLLYWPCLSPTLGGGSSIPK